MELTRRDRLRAADQRLHDHLAEAARHWWGIGAVCVEVDRDELYAEDGYEDVWAWARERHGISRRTVTKAMEVARHFSAEMAERWGTEKLSSTLAYLAATRRMEEAGDVSALVIKVRREGRYRSIPFEKASYRDLDEARALVLSDRRAGAPEPDPAMIERALAIEAALPKAKGERVTVRRGADGKHRLTFKDIAEDELEAFARAVLGID